MGKSLKPLIRRIDKHLAERLKDYRSGLMPTYLNERIVGYIVSSSFQRLDHGVRQRRLEKLLAEALDPMELLLLGPIVTMTPAEADVGRAAG